MRKFYLLLFSVIVISCNKEKVQNLAAAKNFHAMSLSSNSDSVVLLKTLKINGALCPFDRLTKTYYFPASAINPANSYTLNFDSTRIKTMAINNVPVKSNTHVNIALAINLQAAIQVTDTANNVYNCTLVVTGLPFVNIHITSVVGDSISYGYCELIDPDYIAHNGQRLVNTNISMQLHGSSSLAYQKHSFEIKTLDSSGNELDQSLLGLRTDQSWILDGMYIDQARMRNRLCTDMWNSFNNVPYIASQPTAFNGTRGYLTELTINDEYQGVYCLTEKLDRKQLQASKTYGVVYKADDANPMSAFTQAAIPYNDDSDTWGGWEFSWPNFGSTPEPTWSYLADFDTFVSTSSDSLFTADIGTRINLPNVVDYFLFINVIGADDNDAKNQYFSFYSSKSNPQFFYSVWDMDGSMGRTWDGIYDSDTQVYGTTNYLFSRLIALNVGGFRDMMKARWNSLKTNQLSKNTVNLRILAFAKQLILTNAGSREMVKWGNITQSFTAEATYMSNWYSAHYDNLDNYINGKL